MKRLISPLFLSLLQLAPLSGCATPEEEEIKVGSQAAPLLEKQFGGAVPDPALARYVSSVGQRIVPYTKREELPWEFKVLNSQQINAFALPGGKVYITRGLLARLENEAQLASILGHEIGHVVRGHSAQQLERAQSLQDAATAAMLAGSGGNSEITPFIAGLRKYSRDQEREADLSGLYYLAASGYDPHAMVRTMEILKRASTEKSQPEFLSTHPDLGNREEYLREAIEKRYR